jgi:hypothetical protein
MLVSSIVCQYTFYAERNKNVCLCSATTTTSDVLATYQQQQQQTRTGNTVHHRQERFTDRSVSGRILLTTTIFRRTGHYGRNLFVPTSHPTHLGLGRRGLHLWCGTVERFATSGPRIFGWIFGGTKFKCRQFICLFSTLPYQDRVLTWGIYGAVLFRAIMIAVGAVALQQFHGILLVFAGILVYSSARILLVRDTDEDDEDDPSQNQIIKLSRSLIQSVDDFDGDRFFTVQDGVRFATPLFICMVAVEISDIVFAVDSIPAVFGVTNVSCMMVQNSFGSNLYGASPSGPC